ncbi:MAG: hypothetical protein ABI846_08965 [Rudaea sp.]
MFGALRVLGELSPAQRTMLAKKRFAGEFTPEALLDQMRALAAFDRSGDADRKKAGRWAVAAFFQVVIGAVASLFFGRWLLLYSLAMAVTAVVLAFIWYRLRLSDISKNLGAVALPFVAILKLDMKPDQTLTVDIDLSEPMLARKRQAASPKYKRGAYIKIVDTKYADAWFSGSARLADATVLRWRVVDNITLSKRTKRTPRGKYKMSTRQAKRSVISVAVALSRKSYAIGPAERSTGAKATVSASDKNHMIRLVRKVKSKSLDPLEWRALVDLVSDAYRRAVPATRSAA